MVVLGVESVEVESRRKRSRKVVVVLGVVAARVVTREGRVVSSSENPLGTDRIDSLHFRRSKTVA